MLPSWGCSQSSLIVGIGPMLSLSICCASISCPLELRVLGDRAADERWSDSLQHLLLRALDDARRTET